MFDEILGKVKSTGFRVSEVITDKDSLVNSIFCRHFPECTITYCSNHCAKTLHKDLQKIKQNKCEVSYFLQNQFNLLHFYSAELLKQEGDECFHGSCKAALSNLICYASKTHVH